MRVREDRRRAPLLDLDQLPHGDRRTYLRGCRCEPCTEASRQYKRDHAKAAHDEAGGQG